jgi:Domain of unknown function (DUF4389)
MNELLNDNLKKTSTWKRIIFMLLLAVIVSIVRTVLWAVILLQVVTTLLTGSSNANILSFSRSLSAYLYHITLYLTFNTEVLPFPFSDWQVIEQFDLPEHQTPPHK